MKVIRGFLTLAVATTGAAPAFACGPMAYAAEFWSTRSSGPTLEELVGGRLGILDLNQDPRRLYVGYRHLGELGVGPASQGKLLAALEIPPQRNQWQSGVQPWIAARRQVPGAEKLDWLRTEREIQRVEATYSWTEFQPNCLDSAFATAAAALTERIDRYGADSAAVREWLSGQDAVFSLCSEGGAPPRPLDDSWPAELRRDREYQIAAGHFYAFHHDEALARFEQIGNDPESPWRDLARYLVARTAVRAGDPERARQAIAEMLADSTMTDLHPALRRLATLIEVRGNPVGRRKELGEKLLAPSLAGLEPQELNQDLIDFLWLTDGRAPGAGLPTGDLELWLTVMAGRSPISEVPTELGVPPPSPHPAITLWRERRTLSWLVAALAAATGSESEIPDLLAAAAAVPADSPAALSVGYQQARLRFVRGGEDAAVQDLLDRLLKRDDLSTGSANRVSQLRAALAPTLDEYLSFSLLVPVELGFTDGYQIWDDEQGAPRPRLLTDEAVAYLNRAVPLRGLARIAAKPDLLTPDWRQRIGLAAWVGALLAGEDELAGALVPTLVPLVPEKLGVELEAWRAQAPGPERELSAWLAMLRFPGMSPVIANDVGRRTPLDEADSLRANGWCERAGLSGAVLLEPVRFLPAEKQLAAGADGPWPDLAASPLYLGVRVIAYAEAHRDDPRVPEALHRVVRATRVGCAWGDEVGKVSKRAFELLHRRYPESEWTKKTPYWFTG